ncbi:MAG: hypothetical protein GY781_15815, partial [Gammaproteobacteria bacterium]|nr:hypothetical protein [Gammaproteobacteria bacterium]
AAVSAIVMHLLHIIDAEVLITITVVLIAVLFIRDLRRERITDEMHSGIEESRSVLRSIQTNIIPPDAILIGPCELRAITERFAAQASGEMKYFHICLSMFKPQSLFDTMLRPAIENPQVTSIQFTLDENQKILWESDVLPKINVCSGSHKVKSPKWIKIQEPISMIFADVGSKGETECLLSFWGEPFMATSSERSVPRYIFHIQGHSELVTRLIEVERNYRFEE